MLLIVTFKWIKDKKKRRFLKQNLAKELRTSLMWV